MRLPGTSAIAPAARNTDGRPQTAISRFERDRDLVDQLIVEGPERTSWVIQMFVERKTKGPHGVYAQLRGTGKPAVSTMWTKPTSRSRPVTGTMARPVRAQPSSSPIGGLLHVSIIEKIRGELGALTAGVDKARGLTAAAGSQAQEVGARAAGAGFAAVAVDTARVRDAIQNVQASFGRFSAIRLRHPGRFWVYLGADPRRGEDGRAKGWWR